MEIEAGKRYMRRDGKVSGEIMCRENPDYPFIDPESRITYSPSGREYIWSDRNTDLVAEHHPADWPTQKIAGAINDLQISEVVKTSDEIAAKFGAVKHDQDKPRYDLLPGDALHQVVLAFTYGATKYSPRNWEHGIAWGRLFAALMRHCWAFWRGENDDPETGMHHMAHAGACVLMLLASVGRGVGTDDRRTQ